MGHIISKRHIHKINENKSTRSDKMNYIINDYIIYIS